MDRDLNDLRPIRINPPRATRLIASWPSMVASTPVKGSSPATMVVPRTSSGIVPGSAMVVVVDVIVVPRTSSPIVVVVEPGSVVVVVG